MDCFTCLNGYADATARLLNYCGYFDDDAAFDYYDCNHSSWVVGYLTDLSDRIQAKTVVWDKTSPTAIQYYLEGLDQSGQTSGLSYIMVILPDGSVIDSLSQSQQPPQHTKTVLRQRQLSRKFNRDAIAVAIAALTNCCDLADLNYLMGIKLDPQSVATTVKFRIRQDRYPCNLAVDHITTRFLALIQQAADLTEVMVRRQTWNLTKVKVLLDRTELPDYDPVIFNQLLTAQLDCYRQLTKSSVTSCPSQIDPSDIKSAQWLVGRSYDQAVADLAKLEPHYQLDFLTEEIEYYQPNCINVVVDNNKIITAIVTTASGRWRF